MRSSLAYSPSRHQKRVLLYGEWVEQHVLEPVSHRQYVFTLPKLLRPLFGRHRAWLGELCRIAARLLLEAYALAAPVARPGLILFVQTFGDLAHFNPHIHVLANDWAFLSDGSLVRLAPVPEALFEQGFQQAVLAYLAKAGAISQELRASSWGGSIAASRFTTRCPWSSATPRAERSSPATCSEPPMSLEKMTYDAAKCQGPMRVVALIDDPHIVRRILEHLGRWAPLPAQRGPPAQAPEWPRGALIPLTYHPVPDIA